MGGWGETEMGRTGERGNWRMGDKITSYKDLRSEPFPWLNVDYNNLALHASHVGLNCEMVCPGEHYDYLARLTEEEEEEEEEAKEV